MTVRATPQTPSHKTCAERRRRRRRDKATLTSAAGATAASAAAQAVALAGAVAVALLPLITWSWEDLGPGAVAAGWWVRAGAGAARLRALLPAPRGTRAGAAMAPGFGIAFLGDALGPLGSAQEKLHHVIMLQRGLYLEFISNTLKSSSPT